MADRARPLTPKALHRAARAEDALHALSDRWLRRRGWRPRVVAYAGYGGEGWVRVLARVLLAPDSTRTPELREEVRDRRGWRRFVTASAADVAVTVEVGTARHTVVSGRGGYLDVVLDADLPPGRHEAVLSVPTSTSPARAPITVVGAGTSAGLVSDIDDTVLVTAMPRPLLAGFNTFVRHETARRPVPGMPALYREFTEQHPDAPVVYLSTGAWNVAPAIEAFLDRHGYPRGPLLMTDWGPTADAWFRSGREHQRQQLRRLREELPQVRWLLVGDDGQHDPQLYDEAATAAPERVRAVAIRQLTAIQQVLTHGTPEPLPEGSPRPEVLEVRGRDGWALMAALRERGVLRPARGGGG